MPKGLSLIHTALSAQLSAILGCLTVIACGAADLVDISDASGSYLYADELNMQAAADNTLHIYCRRSNNQPIDNVWLNVAAQSLDGKPFFLSDNWLLTDTQGQVILPFTLREAGLYSLTLQIKQLSASKALTTPPIATQVQVIKQGSERGIARGTKLNSQLLLLTPRGALQRARQTTIGFASSDALAVLPQPITLSAQDGGNKIVSQGSQLFTLGKQTLWAIDSLDGRIVSEQHYQVTLGNQDVFRGVLSPPSKSTIADGQAVAAVQLTLTDADGVPTELLPVQLIVDEGNQQITLLGQTDKRGVTVFELRSTIAGSKAIEARMQTATGFVPIAKSQVEFAPGPMVGFRFLTSPQGGQAGSLLLPAPSVQAVDGFGNLVPLNDVPVSLLLRSGIGGELDASAALAGTTTLVLQEGLASFDAISVRTANNLLRLQASSPGLDPQNSAVFAITPAAADRLVFVQQPQTGLTWGQANLVQVVLQDAFGNLIERDDLTLQMTLQAGASGATLSAASSVQMVAGLGSFNAATSTSGQGFTLQVSASEPQLQPASSQLFNVLPGVPDLMRTTVEVLTLTPVVANNIATVRLKVTARDSQNAPIRGAVVQGGSLSAQDSFRPQQAATDSNGVVEIELASTLAGEKDIWLDVGAISPIVQPKPIFVADAVASANAQLNQSSQVANGVATLQLTAQLQDSFGNTVPNVSYTLTSSIPTDVLTPAASTTDGQGQLQATWQATWAGPRVLQLQAQTYNAPPIAAVFMPGPPSQLHSSLTALPNPTIADGQATAVLQAVLADAFNNPIPNTEVFFTAQGQQNELSHSLLTTDSNGQATATLRSSASQEKRIVAKTKTITLQTTATFVPKPCLGTPVLSLGQANITLKTDTNPSDIVSGDFNQDSLIDLAIVNYASNTLSIFISQANGTFAPQVTYATQSYPTTLTALDVNRDGRIDLAVVNDGSDSISVFIGQGDGTFAPQVTYATDSYPWALTTHDVNRDGITDLAVVNGSSDNLGIFIGQADGTFAPQVTYPTGGGPTALIALDVNRDSISDLAVANYSSNTLSIFIGQADGSFAPQVTYDTGWRPQALTATDVNRDGLTDLAVLSTWSDTLGIFMGQADGTFAPQVTYATSTYPWALTALDVNRDGITDLAVANYYSTTFGIFIGQADGTFAPQVTYTTSNYPTALKTIDVNQDGISDLVVANYWSDSLSLFIGQPNGSFASQVTYGADIKPIALTSLDTNQDTITDLAVVNYYSNTLGIFIGQGDGTFAPQVNYATGSRPQDLTAIDINRDGKADLAVANAASNTVGIFISQANGTFAAQATYPTGPTPTALLALDVNRDNITDLAVTNYLDNTLGILLGQADSTFAPQVTYGTDSQPQALRAVDVNLDGIIDLAVVNATSNTLSIFIGQADSTFAPQVTYGTDSQPQSIQTLDVNRDGINDLVVVNYASYTLGLFIGQVGGTFAPQMSIAVGAYPEKAITGDINQDGILDVLIAGTQMSLLIGTGNGDFLPAIIYNQSANDVVVADFNQNFVPDMALLSNSGLQIIERVRCEP